MTTRVDRLPQRRADVFLADDNTRSVVIDPTSDVPHVLNPTARAIWELCDGATTIEEAAGAICQVFSVSQDEAVAGVIAVVDQFAAANLLSWAHTATEAG
jgi:hypothetical protein